MRVVVLLVAGALILGMLNQHSAPTILKFTSSLSSSTISLQFFNQPKTLIDSGKCIFYKWEITNSNPSIPPKKNQENPRKTNESSITIPLFAMKKKESYEDKQNETLA